MKTKRVLCVGVFLLGTIPLFSAGFTRDIKVTQPRMQGSDVADLQKKLLSLGYTEVGAADGWYGPKTEEAVRRYQKYLGLERNGIVVKDVWDSLFTGDPTIRAVNAILKSVNAFRPVLAREFQTGPRIYNYSTNDDSQLPEWTLNENHLDDVSLYQIVVPLWSPRLGYYIYTETNSPASDWTIEQEDYYDADGDLIFIEWRMNTRYGSIGDEYVPVSVEKTIYFDSLGEELLRTVKSFRMNRDEPVDAEYMDVDVEVNYRVMDRDCLKLIGWR